jgi:RNA polymerase sigma factor (sigma-70 family)
MEPQAIPAANAVPPPAAAERVARDAFHALVDSAGNRMYRLALRMTGSAEDARDVLQEGFLKAFRSFARGGFEGHSDRETWLYRIVVHAALDFLKTDRRARRRERDWSESRAAAGPSPELRVALVEMQRWLTELPELQRVALMAHAQASPGAAVQVELHFDSLPPRPGEKAPLPGERPPRAAGEPPRQPLSPSRR